MADSPLGCNNVKRVVAATGHKELGSVVRESSRVKQLPAANRHRTAGTGAGRPPLCSAVLGQDDPSTPPAGGDAATEVCRAAAQHCTPDSSVGSSTLSSSGSSSSSSSNSNSNSSLSLEVAARTATASVAAATTTAGTSIARFKVPVISYSYIIL